MQYMKTFFEPILEISIAGLLSNIRKLGCNATIDHLHTEWKKMANAVDYPYGNEKLRFSDGNAPVYAFQLRESGSRWCLAVWNATGMIALGNFYLDKHDFSDGEYNRFFKMLINWRNGYKACSGCGTLINHYATVNQNFYAGTYCDNCWNNGMKQKAANENYN